MSVSHGYTRQATRQGKVPTSTKLFQGVGGIVNALKDFAFNTFLLLFYSQILGVSASLVSIVLAIALIFDAVSDPVVGSISDNLRSKLGRRHPFMFASAIPLAISMYFLFSPPPDVSHNFLLAWLLFFTVLLRTAFTCFMIPWNAIAAEFSNDYIERTLIITYRYMVGIAGGVTFSMFAWTYLFPNTETYPAGQLNPEHYSSFGLITGILMMLFALVSAGGTKKEIPYLLQPEKPTPSFSLSRVFDETKLALSSANFRRLFILFILFSGLAGIGGVFDIYMNTFFWEFTSDELKWFALAAVGSIFSFLTVPFIQRSIDKHTLMQWFLSLYMIGAILKVCFRFWGVWPENGDPALLNMLVIHATLQAYFMTTVGIMVGSLIADLMDEQELVTGKRQEGMFSSAISFAVKGTVSIGIVVGGVLLDYVIALPKQAEIGSIDADILFTLAVTDGVAIPLLFFVPIYLMSKITMTRVRLAQVQAELELRRTTKPAASTESPQADGMGEMRLE